MITYVDLDFGPMYSGQRRPLSIQADEPIRVEVKCFVDEPPPTRLRACRECGSYTLRSGEVRMVEANNQVFAQEGGRIVIQISDAKGDHKEITLDVSKTSYGMASS